jgi:hypothetical protein
MMEECKTAVLAEWAGCRKPVIRRQVATAQAVSPLRMAAVAAYRRQAAPAQAALEA